MKVLAVILLCSLVLACGGSGDNTPGGATKPTVTKEVPPISLSNAAEDVAGIDAEYTFKPDLGSTDFEVEIIRRPDWLSYNGRDRLFYGTPVRQNVPEANVRDLISVVFKSEKNSIPYDWFIYYVDHELQAYKYKPKKVKFDIETLKALKSQAESIDQESSYPEYRELLDVYRNTLGQYIHNMHVFQEAIAEGKRISVYDDGIYLSDPVSGAVIYRAHVRQETIREDSHGTRMARYMLNYAPGIRLTDIAVTTPLSIAGQYSIEKENRIFSYSGGSSNIDGYEPEKIAAMTKMIKDGLFISQSIGNNSDLTSDDSHQQKIWFYNTHCNRTDLSDETMPSYLFGNPVNFLGQLNGMQAIYDGPGALVKVQAVTLDYPDPYLNIDLLTSIPRKDWRFSSVRTKLGFAMHDGISVMENGSGATSQAAASLSGIVALLMEYAEKERVELTARQLADIIFSTADDIGDLGVDPVFGHGLVNAEAAAQLITDIARGQSKIPVVKRSDIRLDPELFDRVPEKRRQLNEIAKQQECSG